MVFFLSVTALRTERIKMMFPEISETCFHYFVGLFIFLANEVDTIVMQIDRIFAVHYSFKYKATVTNSKVIAVCVGAKGLAVLFLALAFFIDTNYSECVDHFGFFFTKPVNIIFISFPQLIITGGVLVVSIVLGRNIVKAKKSVTPVVTVTYINVEEASKNASTSLDMRIKRQNEEPNMFYRTQLPHNSNKTLSSELNKIASKNAFKVAKEALNANYIVIFFCLANTPVSISSIVYSGCQPQKEDCDFFLVLFRHFIPFKLLAIVSCVLTVICKLRKTNV